MQQSQQRQRRHFKKQEPMVEDLREKLNRMRLGGPNSTKEETDKGDKAPPRDPSYNFLKDPLRDEPIRREKKHKNPNKQKPARRQAENEKETINPPPRPTNERHYKGVREIQELLRKPINVNVEVSTTSGERKCVLDETKVVDISYSNKQYPHRPQFRRQPGDFHKYYGDAGKSQPPKADGGNASDNRKEEPLKE